MKTIKSTYIAAINDKIYYKQANFSEWYNSDLYGRKIISTFYPTLHLAVL